MTCTPRFARHHALSLGVAVLATTALAACGGSKRPATRPFPSEADSVQVGYGTQAKRDLTSSVSSIEGDEAKRNSPTSVADMIDGRFPGVEVKRLAAGGISIRIRGARSINNSNEPLFVIDGVPRMNADGGVLADLHPNDIKSIQVLKDAGATSVYGSRGANGVIMITTKKK